MENSYIMYDSLYLNLKGNPVKRTPITNPYDYDEYVLFKSDKYSNERPYSAVYSDRLMQWDYDRFQKCYKETFSKDSQSFYLCDSVTAERFLSLYFNKDIELVAMLQGCNVSNGNPYWVFYYIDDTIE